MPGGDRTGPMGAGPMTGRGMGYCAGFGVPGFWNRLGLIGRLGRGGWFGRARGGGRRWRNWLYATGLTGWQRAAMGWPAWSTPVEPIPPVSPAGVTREQELEILNRQAEHLTAALQELRSRIDQLQSQASSSSAT